MRFVYITFRSVTPAQRGEEALNRAGFRCTLQRTPRWMEERGCGYRLRLLQSNLNAALNLLRDQQVPFQKIYVQRENGKLEEWQP